MKRALPLLTSTVLTLCATATAAIAAPIEPTGPAPSLPTFQGHATSARPLPASKVTHPPHNPFMADGPNGNVHNDAWMTDAYHRSGPLGRSLRTASDRQRAGICVSLTFDGHGHLVTLCPNPLTGPDARIVNPRTLAVTATYELPQAPDPPGTKPFQNATGGGYFYLDNRDRMWIPTKTDHIYVLAERKGGHRLARVRDYDLTGALDDSTQRVISALPDFSGRVWFTTKQDGVVGTLDPSTGRVRTVALGEEIANSFAVGKYGVYIVSDKRMYRFTATRKGTPKVVWKARYPNSGIAKPGQFDAGSGTTPTIMRGGYVAITDNADPMDVVVYRTAKRLRDGERRKVCTVPVFRQGASATENSLIGSGNSLIVENNYGYQDPLGPDSGAVTKPGFARVDVKRDGSGCRKVWTNREVRAPTVVPKLSTKTGLIYAYTRPPDPSGAEGYYWTAIDFRTGRTAWSRYAGSGLAFNNNYAGLALGPGGAAYLGVAGGIAKLEDGS